MAHPHCSMYRIFIPFYGRIIFHCVCVYVFIHTHTYTHTYHSLFIHSPVMDTWVAPPLASVSTSAMNMGVQESESLLSTFLDVCLGVKAGSHGNSVFNFLRYHQTVFHGTSPFYILTNDA